MAMQEWLESLGLGQYSALFAEQSLTFDLLPSISDEDLRHCGITSLGHRKLLLTEIAKRSYDSILQGAPKVPVIEAGDRIAVPVQAAPVISTPSGLPKPPPLAVTSAAASSGVPILEAVTAAPVPNAVPSQGVPMMAQLVAEEAPLAPSAPLEAPLARGIPVPVMPVAPPPSYHAPIPPVNAGPTMAEMMPEMVTASVLPEMSEEEHQKRKRVRWGGSFLLISIVAHILFGVIATYLVVQTIQAKRKLNFQGGQKGPNASTRSIEHKVSMQKKSKSMGAPVQAKRITTTGVAKVALPAMPAMPSSVNEVTPGAMSGMGGMGTGYGLGFGGGGSGGGGGGGGGSLSFFGLRSATGFVGTFHDYKKESSGKPGNARLNKDYYESILKGFVNGSSWSASSKPHFTSKAKLSAKAFFFPAIVDTQAGQAFQTPDTGPGYWVAHYAGMVTAPVTGRFRFVGWGDNVMIVGINGKLALDATDLRYIDKGPRSVGAVSFPRKGNTPLFEGEWFNVSQGQSIKLDVLLGDQGGIFCAGLFLQKEGTNYSKGKGGIPNLPLFMVGNISTDERKLYKAYLDNDAFNGPVFLPRSAGFGGFSN